MCAALTLPADTAAVLLNQIDLDEDGEWSYGEFLRVLQREDYCTYHSTVGSQQPLVPDKIVPAARKFNLFSGRPYTPPEVFAKRKLMAGAVQGAAYPVAQSPGRSPSVSSARAGRRSARGSGSAIGDAYAQQSPMSGSIHSPRPPQAPMVTIQQGGESTGNFDTRTTERDFRAQPKRGFDREMGQASKLGALGPGSNRVRLSLSFSLSLSLSLSLFLHAHKQSAVASHVYVCVCV